MCWADKGCAYCCVSIRRRGYVTTDRWRHPPPLHFSQIITLCKEVTTGQTKHTTEICVSLDHADSMKKVLRLRGSTIDWHQRQPSDLPGKGWTRSVDPKSDALMLDGCTEHGASNPKCLSLLCS